MAHLEHVGAGSQGEVAPPGLMRRRLQTLAQSQVLYRILPYIAFGLGLLFWEWSVAVGRTSALFFPAPTTIARTLVQLSLQGPLLQDIGTTLSRMGLGLLIGGGLGAGFGILMGWSVRIRLAAEPLVASLHPIPKSSLLPLLLLLLGLGERPRITLIALAAFFPMLINTMHGVRSIEASYIEAAANYGARHWRLFWRVILPASLPGMLAGLRLAANSALTLAITAELLMSRSGLGARIWMAWETMRTENLYAVLVVIALIGICINQLLVWLTYWLMPWINQEKREGAL